MITHAQEEADDLLLLRLGSSLTSFDSLELKSIFSSSQGPSTVRRTARPCAVRLTPRGAKTAAVTTTVSTSGRTSRASPATRATSVLRPRPRAD